MDELKISSYGDYAKGVVLTVCDDTFTMFSFSTSIHFTVGKIFFQFFAMKEKKKRKLNENLERGIYTIQCKPSKSQNLIYCALLCVEEIPKIRPVYAQGFAMHCRYEPPEVRLPICRAKVKSGPQRSR